MRTVLALFILCLAFPNIANATYWPWECLSLRADGSLKSDLCRNGYKKNEKSSKSNVCGFVGGQWAMGTVKYKRKTDSFAFETDRLCTRGITAIEVETPNRFIGPTVKMRDVSGSGVTRVGKVFTSTVNFNGAAPSLGLNFESTNKRPVKCALSGNEIGPTRIKDCGQHPNLSGYCDFRNVNTDRFKGRWWVRYKEPEQGEFEVCKYGVLIRDLQALSNQNEAVLRTFKYKSASPKIENLTKANFITNYLGTAIPASYNSGSDIRVGACYSDFGAGIMRRYSCDKSTLFVRPNGAPPERAKVDHCYAYDNGAGAWDIVYMLADEAGSLPAAYQCSRIEVLDRQVFRPNTEDN